MKGYTQRRSQYPLAANKRGSVLVLALWALSLLTVFASLLGYGVRQKLSVVYRLDDRSALRYIAEAGAKRAIARIREISKDKVIYSLRDGGNDPALFEAVRVGTGSFSVSHDHRDDPEAEKTIFYGFTDEESKINLNLASPEVIKNLFMELGLTETASKDLASSIIDWSDADSDLSEPFGSGEDSYYRSLSSPYEAKDSEFSAIDELFLVKDMDANTFDKIKDYVTIYGNGMVNVNTASSEVLLALGLGKDITEKILVFRRGEDGVRGTEDDNVFVSTSSISQLLALHSGLSDSQLAHLNGIASLYLTVDSSFFHIKSRGSLPGKKLFMEVVSVADTTGSVMYWRESYKSGADVNE